MLDVHFNNKFCFSIEDWKNRENVIQKVKEKFGLEEREFYLLCNGKICNFDCQMTNLVHVVLKLVGGKGGFGSMLRAIGAQIEKTTNREACRDLSGRRLRDINEEKRLKNWIDQQADREQEAADKKQKKLERLCQKPRHEFKDETYDKERSDLPERLEDAVTQGLAASASTSVKRKSETDNKKIKKKKIWLDDELSELSEDESSSEKGEESKDNKDQESKGEEECKKDEITKEEENVMNVDEDHKRDKHIDNSEDKQIEREKEDKCDKEIGDKERKEDSCGKNTSKRNAGERVKPAVIEKLI